MAVAYFQPVTRGEISEMFGREISRDLIAALREEGLIAAGPRSPKLGAPYAYVTTEKFLLEFGLESLRDLPDIEALKDAGLLPAGAATREGDAVPDEGQGGDSLLGSESRGIASHSSMTAPRFGVEVRIPQPLQITLMKLQA